METLTPTKNNLYLTVDEVIESLETHKAMLPNGGQTPVVVALDNSGFQDFHVDNVFSVAPGWEIRLNVKQRWKHLKAD